MSKTTYYINGNAVREIGQPQPQRRPQKTRRELEEARRRKNEPCLCCISYIMCYRVSSGSVFTYKDQIKCHTADERGCRT